MSIQPSKVGIVGAGNVGAAVANALVLLGKSVNIVFKEKVEATGARHVPIRRGIDYSTPETIPQSWTEQRDALKGVDQY